MIIHSIYKITNIKNGKIYIGQTLNASKRWSQHKAESKKETPSMTINCAMKKYGIENFSFEIVASCLDLDSANNTETLMVIQEGSHVSLGKGYNVSNGGSNSSKTDDTKRKLSEALKGKPKSESHRDKIRSRKNSEETRLKISRGNKGKIISDESKSKMSKSRLGLESPMKGKSHSEETKEKIRQSSTGKKMSSDAIAKTSKANKSKMIGNKNSLGHKCSEESKKKMSEAAKKRVFSEETKKKMSEARKGKKYPKINIDTDTKLE